MRSPRRDRRGDKGSDRGSAMPRNNYREWDIKYNHKNSHNAGKVYVGNLGSSASKHEIESAFGKYGPLRNIWVARNPPGFAFVEYEDARDAEDAVRALDGSRVCGNRIRVEMSSGRSRPNDRRGGGSSRRGGSREDRRSRRDRSRSPRRSPVARRSRSSSRRSSESRSRRS